MPLTKSGRKVLSRMKEKYGSKKGEVIFYASINKGAPGSNDWHKKKEKHMGKSKYTEALAA